MGASQKSRHAKSSNLNYFLRVIIVSDVPHGSIYGIFIYIIYIYTYKFWFSIWHSFWHMYLAYFLTFFLAYLRRFFVLEVWWGTLWSRARGVGPAGNTLIQRLLLELAGNTAIGDCSLQLRSGGGHFDPKAAVRVWWGTLWSRACSWGPAEEGGGGRQASWHKI